MKNYLEQLNPSQKSAVKHLDGPVMVIAGAGSGKTRVLTYRIAHLLKSGIKTHNILALTFTNKASKEMLKRIEEILGFSSRSLWVGTFHSIFSKILRFESDLLNYPTNFTIYDSDDSKNLIKSIIKEMGLDKDIYKASMIKSRISSLKNNFITASSYQNRLDLIQNDKIAKRTEFSRIYQAYVNRCKKASAMDFDDLLLYTYKILNNFPETLLKYQQRFKYILIDEYQDTNHVQYLIIKKLAALNENLCVVGDDSQSIYSFRGANIQNILNFQVDYPDFTTYKLEQNYRSTSNIVEAANCVIENNENRIEKKVWTNNASGDKIIICKTGSDNDEGRLVANTISEIQYSSQSFHKEFAVLYRTNAQSRSIEESLRKRNIPYKIYGGVSFYQRKEVKDLLAYYRLCINPSDEEAFKRIINYPSRGIGLTTLQKINIAANNNGVSMWQLINNLSEIETKINKGTQNKLASFAYMINDFIIKSNSVDAYIIAEEIAKSTGLLSNLHNDKTPEGVSRFENIQELLNGIRDFTETSKEDNKLSDFMSEISLLTDQDRDTNDDLDKVTLMTVHAAKGLEFPYVFLVGLEENLFPSMMSGESLEALEEERRLFYVAMTRAEKRLFLSFATNRFKWGQYIDCEPSRFLSEINEEFLEKREVSITKKKKYNIYAKTTNESNKKYNTGNLKKVIKTNNSDNYNSTYEKIRPGSIVKHISFGKGNVISISDEGASKKAIVFFSGFGQKNLLLKFAKLEIIEF